MVRGSRAATAQENEAPQSTALARIDPKVTIETVRLGLEERTAMLAAYLEGQDVTPERFAKTVIQAIAQNRNLGLSTPSSLIYAVLDAAQLGLEPTGILGGAWLVPYWSSKLGAFEAKLIVGYRGYIDLFRRSGEVETIEARVVYGGDEFDVSYGTEQRIRHVPYFIRGEESGERVGVYWIARMRGGATQFDVVSIADVEKARRSSKARGGGPWTDWYDEMAKKTAIRRAVSTLPVSVFGARRAVQLENEAEEAADAAPTASVSIGKKTARERAVELIGGGGEAATTEEAAPQDEAGGNAAPEGETGNAADEAPDADSGRPTGSEAVSGVVMDSEDGLPDVPELGL